MHIVHNHMDDVLCNLVDEAWGFDSPWECVSVTLVPLEAAVYG